MNGVERIRRERRRQIANDGEAWSRAHDRNHDDGQLALAAAAYAIPMPLRVRPIWNTDLRQMLWPYGWDFKPADRIRELEKAGALIAAEIDRLLEEDGDG